MALSKALIIPEGGIPIPVLFNPTQYSLDRSNQFAEIGIPGLGAPVLQYVRGNASTLSMELFFDTYEQKIDVRLFTELVYGLLRIDPEKHAPPVCLVTWGTFMFRGVLDRVGGRFTLFLPTGIPVRATLNVSFREYVDVDVEVRRNPLQSSDHTKSRAVKRGDTLSGVASAEYGDPTQWRPIAEANGIDNPRMLTPGVLVVPPLA